MFISMTGTIVRLSFLLLGIISLAACDSITDAALPDTAPVASNVSITDNNGGDAMVGDDLTGNYAYADEENDAEGSSTYRWLRNGETIGGATTSSYTLVSADSSQSIAFEVTPVAVKGISPGAAVTSAAITVIISNHAPTASNVSITDDDGGNALIGDSLTGNYLYADIEGDVEGTSTFRWLRNGIAISGATNKAYTLISADSAASITFEVTPVAATGTTTGNAVTSSAVAALNFAPIASNPSITDNNSGNILLGVTLSGNYTYFDAESDGQGATAFRWLRNGVAISGATAQSYTLVAADVGKPIRFEVTPVAVTGTILGSTVTSPAITVVNSAPTASSVTITDDNGGIAIVGDSLTGNYTYSDLEGDSEDISKFRWLRSGVAISGATSKTYILVADDSGPSITFEVTPVALTGTLTGSPATSGGITLNNSVPTASNVVITNSSAVVGNTLTANYTFNDIDGDNEGTSTYRWLRDGNQVATTASYLLVAADSEKTMTFEVTPVDDTGNTGTAVTSLGLTIDNSAPTATTVSITNSSAVVGDTLTASYTFNDVDGDSEGTSTYRWLRDGSQVATTASYTLLAADTGKTMVFEVTPVDDKGNTGIAAASLGLTIDNSAPTATAVSIINSSAVVGNTLTATYTFDDIDGDSEGSSTYRWLRDGSPVATTVNYILVAADSGKTMTFEVTPVDDMGNTGSPVVSPVGLIISNSAPVANAGSDQTPLVSATVTLDGSGSSDVDGDGLTFSWSFTSVPVLSSITTASLSDATAVSPTFVVDAAGTYVVQLIVNDSTVDSNPDTVSISTTNSAPVANAGADQTTPLVGETVTLDGSGSSDVDGDGLTFSWSFTSVPALSSITTASLSDATAVSPTFVVDAAGTYVVQLIVNDSTVDSNPDTVSISTTNSKPVANAGADQTTPLVGETVTLDGSGSSDVDVDGLTYSWSFISVPGDSLVTTASLSDATAVSPTFMVDAAGTYVVQLIVNDSTVDSNPDSVSISTTNSKPVANAGPDQNPLVSATVTLDGSNSNDADGDILTYSWSFVSVPGGSLVTTASLSDATAVNPDFVVDEVGDYVVQLIVNDDKVGSDPVTVNINVM